MLCRNTALSQEVAAGIRAQVPGATVDTVQCDLANLHSVRLAAEAVRRHHDSIDRLILNAGMAALSRQRTSSGMDLNFAVNHLGHFLLTELLRDRMAAEGRIITVASRAHFRGNLNLEDVADPQERISTTASYARSKLANVLHSFALARQFSGSSVSVNCLHPGIVATHLLPGWVRIIQRVIRGQMFDEVRGARPTLYLALSPDAASMSGRYFDENATPEPASSLAQDVSLQDALWQRSLEWTNR